MTSRGFTLVEMLVAMAVFSLLAVAASSLLGVSLRNADVFTRADAATRELQIARTIMRADFAQIARRPVRDAYGAPTPTVFAGGAAVAEKPILSFVRYGWDNPGGIDPRASLHSARPRPCRPRAASTAVAPAARRRRTTCFAAADYGR